MVMLRNLSVKTKKYALLHAKIDSLNQLESALRFHDSHLRILDFQDGSGKGKHANPLQFLKGTRIVLTGKEKTTKERTKERIKTRTTEARAREMRKTKTGKGNKRPGER